MQVGNTSSNIQVGQWIRIFEAQPQKQVVAASGRRVLRENTVRAPRGGSSRRGLTAAAKATHKYLPLPAGMLAAQKEVEQLGLNVEEASEVVAAQAMGTLDSYLYANNAVDSASSESHCATIRKVAVRLYCPS